jgi:hypothetical protein
MYITALSYSLGLQEMCPRMANAMGENFRDQRIERFGEVGFVY